MAAPVSCDSSVRIRPPSSLLGYQVGYREMPTWLPSRSHRNWLDAHTRHLLDFGRETADPGGGARWLTGDGSPDFEQPIRTWVTARMTHVYSLGGLLGVPGSATVAGATM